MELQEISSTTLTDTASYLPHCMHRAASLAAPYELCWLPKGQTPSSVSCCPLCCLTSPFLRYSRNGEKMMQLLLLLCPPWLLLSLRPALCHVLQQCFGEVAVGGDGTNNCSNSRWPPRPSPGTMLLLRRCCAPLMTSAMDEIFETFKHVHHAWVPDIILPGIIRNRCINPTEHEKCS